MGPAKKLIVVAGARPNFIKIAPLMRQLSLQPERFSTCLVHTGQHYDTKMSQGFFTALGIPEPDINFGVGSGSHAVQTASIMTEFEKVCVAQRPDWVVVVGDVNSTLACALVAAKLGVRVAHVEAGLRSFDRTMPEEINRLVTDAIVDVLWTPSADANENLAREGVAADKIDLIGNIMIDSFVMLKEKIEASNARDELGLIKGEYALVTLHRPSNVDALETLEPIVSELIDASIKLPVVFVAHPRTIKSLEAFGLKEQFESAPGVTLLEPLPYIQFMNVVISSKMVITDSGGLQEETTYLDIPCLTLRENTERPITITQGTNKLVTADSLADNIARALSGDWPKGVCPPLWDGATAQRAVECLKVREQSRS